MRSALGEKDAARRPWETQPSFQEDGSRHQPLDLGMMQIDLALLRIDPILMRIVVEHGVRGVAPPVHDHAPLPLDPVQPVRAPDLLRIGRILLRIGADLLQTSADLLQIKSEHGRRDRERRVRDLISHQIRPDSHQRGPDLMQTLGEMLQISPEFASRTAAEQPRRPGIRPV